MKRKQGLRGDKLLDFEHTSEPLKKLSSVMEDKIKEGAEKKLKEER